MNIADRHIGIEVEAETEGYDLGTVHIMLDGPLASGRWEAERDHSLRGGPWGWEVKTSGHDGQRYEDVRSSMFELIPLLTHSTGTWRAAVHCHVDVRDFQSKELSVLLALLYTLDGSIFDVFSPARRESNFCVPLGNEIMRSLNLMHALDEHVLTSQDICKYTSINVRPCTSGRGTFEFRHMATPQGSPRVQRVYDGVCEIWKYARTCATLVHTAKDVVKDFRLANARSMNVRDIGVMLSDTRIIDMVANLDLTISKEATLDVLDRFCSTAQKIPINVDLLSIYRAVGKRPSRMEEVEAAIQALNSVRVPDPEEAEWVTSSSDMNEFFTLNDREEG